MSILACWKNFNFCFLYHNCIRKIVLIHWPSHVMSDLKIHHLYHANSFRDSLPLMQANIRNIIYLNCAERYEDMIDNRSQNPTAWKIFIYKQLSELSFWCNCDTRSRNWNFFSNFALICSVKSSKLEGAKTAFFRHIKGIKGKSLFCINFRDLEIDKALF